MLVFTLSCMTLVICVVIMRFIPDKQFRVLQPWFYGAITLAGIMLETAWVYFLGSVTLRVIRFFI
jgi:hypothetical protein